MSKIDDICKLAKQQIDGFPDYKIPKLKRRAPKQSKKESGGRGPYKQVRGISWDGTSVTYKSIAEAAQLNYCQASGIHHCCRNPGHTAGGKQWEYIKEV